MDAGFAHMNELTVVQASQVGLFDCFFLFTFLDPSWFSSSGFVRVLQERRAGLEGSGGGP